MQKGLQRGNLSDPGLSQMMKLGEDIKSHSQLPSKPQIAAAFRAFFKSRCGRPRSITPKQLAAVTQTFHFLQENKEAEDAGFKGLEKEDLMLILQAMDLCRKANDTIPAILSLARLAYEAFPHAPGEVHNAGSATEEPKPSLFQSYTSILAQTGFASGARHLLETSSLSDPNDRFLTTSTTNQKAWPTVLKGLMKERKIDELLDCLKTLNKDPAIGNLTNSLTKSAADTNDLDLVKKLHEFYRANGRFFKPQTYRNLVMLALKLDDVDFGNEIVKEIQIMDSSPTPMLLSIEFLWSTRGKSPRDVVVALESDVSNGQTNSEQRARNVKTLLEYYVTQGNIAMSAQLLVFMQENGWEPARQIPLLELKHLINTHEWSQAYDAYENLQSVEVSPEMELQLMADLLGGLCRAKDANHEHILTILEDLIKRDAEIGPETVAAAAKALIGHGDLAEFSELLRIKFDDFDSADLDLVQKEFVSAFHNASIDNLRAWDIYELYRKLFPDASVQIRTEIMKTFFKRGHSDLACLVFGHMRQSEIPERRPRADTYADCYMGIAAAGDREGLKLVHNMLKLDLEITPNLKIKNSLIAAYAGSELSYRSFEIYEEILNSTEGPNWNTFAHVLRACEKFPGPGGDEAKTIMQTLKVRDIDLNRDIYIAYIGALAGNLDVGLVTENEIFQALHDMESVVGEKPDAYT